ncbi:unnamed protein product [Lampetra fluviatilis]
MQTESDGSLDTRGARAGPGGTTRCGQERPGLRERRERSPRGALRVACQCREASGAHRERDPLQAGGGGMVEDTDVEPKVKFAVQDFNALRRSLATAAAKLSGFLAGRRSDGEAAVTQKEIAVEPSAWSKEAAVERATFGGGTRGPTRPR